MRTYDFAPLWRSSVGFDRLFDLINDTQRLDAQDNYPPYDIVRTGENAYRISRRPRRLLARRNQHYGAAEQANRCRQQGRAQSRSHA